MKTKLFLMALMMTVANAETFEVLMQCSDVCERVKNQNCNNKCITFSIQDPEVPPEHLNDEECWRINSCDGFPKSAYFRWTSFCSTNCGVYYYDRERNNRTIYMNICLEEYNEDGPMPNICSLWDTISAEGSLAVAFALLLFTLMIS